MQRVPNMSAQLGAPLASLVSVPVPSGPKSSTRPSMEMSMSG